MFQFIVRQMQPLDIRGTVALQRMCFPPPFPEDMLWSAKHLERHLSIFPEGQFVAVAASDDRLGNPNKLGVLASASSLIISEESWQSHSDWETTCGGHEFKAHLPGGSTLFGADISVHPGHRKRGLGKRLYEARFDLVRRLGLARFGTACRLPDFQSWNSQNRKGPEQFAEAVRQGIAQDRTLTPLLKIGLRLVTVIEGHMEDVESGNAAAILEWTP